MIIVQIKGKAIVNEVNTKGFSVIEVLIALLLFSISILGLIEYQQALIARHQTFYTQLKANQLAFQLLDSYPNSATQLVPNGWQYTLYSLDYRPKCKMVFVTITPPHSPRVNQQRLLCQIEKRFIDA